MDGEGTPRTARSPGAKRKSQNRFFLSPQRECGPADTRFQTLGPQNCKQMSFCCCNPQFVAAMAALIQNDENILRLRCPRWSAPGTWGHGALAMTRHD